MSLKNCLAKFPMKGNKNPIPQADRKTLLHAAETYQARGMSPKEAELKAVQDMLDHLEAERGDIHQQVVDAYTKASQNKPSAPVQGTQQTGPASAPPAAPTKAAKVLARPVVESQIPAGRVEPKVEPKALPKEEVPVEPPADAWHRVMDGVPGVPRFGELPEYVQNEWKALDPKDRTRAEAVELAQKPKEEIVKRSEGRAEDRARERVETVRRELRDWMGGYLNPAKIQVVQNIDEIPRAIREAVEKTGPLTKTQGFVHNGKAWMIASNINQGEAKSVFIHEVGAHIGLESMLTSTEHSHVIDTIKEWAERNDGTLEFRVAQTALARLYNADVNEQFKNSELLAYTLEEAVNHGVNPTLDPKTEMGRFLSRVWLMFKKALDKLGWHVKDKMNLQDLVDLGYAAARMQMQSRFQEQSGTQRSYIGMNAETIKNNPDKIADAVMARMMESQGRSAAAIWRTTGFLRGADAKWRTELSDKGAKLVGLDKLFVNPHQTFPLKEILHHPKLFEAYPNLEYVDVQALTNEKGRLEGGASFSPYENKVSLGYIPEGMAAEGLGGDHLSMLMHEIQHWIQSVEEFARGGHPDLPELRMSENLQRLMKQELARAHREGWADMSAPVINRIEQLRDLAKKHETLLEQGSTDATAFHQLMEQYKKRDDIGKQIRYGLYRLIAGEVEAHSVQERMDMNDRERRATFPYAAIPNENQILVQRSVRADLVINAMPAPMQPLTKSIWTTMKNATVKFVNAASLTDDLIDMARKALPSVDRYRDAEYARIGTHLNHEVKIDKIMQQYDKLPHAERGTGAASVNKFIHDSTSNGQWGYQPGFTSVQPEPVMARRFNALSKEGQQLVRDVFQYGQDTLKEMKAVVTAMAQEVYNQSPEKASAFLARYDKLLSMGGTTPYAPLKRFGDYVTIAKSKMFADAELAKDQKTIDKLQDDPNHYHVEFAESLSEAKAIADKLRPHFENGGFVDAGEREAVGALPSGGLFQAMGRLRNMLNQLDDEKVVKEMQGMLRDMELRMLAETSARKSENQRKNIAGANKDMLRAFATQGRANAFFLSTMQHSDEINSALDAMRDEAKKPGNREDGMRYYNEFLRRHAQSFHYDTPMWQNRVKRLTSFWMLATSPAFYFQQLTQTYVMTAPYLAGKHGFFKTEKAIFKAYRDVMPMIKDAGVQNRPDFSLVPADVREMLKTLADHGKIDLGIDIEMGSWVKQGTDPGTINKTIGKVDKLTRGLTSAVETLNRTTAAIAAYRMEKARAMAEGKDERTAHDIATRYAEKTVHVTHGSYDGFNTPRLLSTAFPGARMVTQFRRYQIVQIAMLARLFHNSLKGATPVERAIARKSLMFTLGHAFLLTGSMGTPGIAALAYIAAKMLQGDDEPDTDATREFALRKAIGDEDLANLLLRGAPAAFGFDVSQKLGFNNTFSLTPFVQSDPFTKKGFADTMMALLGPSFSLASKEMDGIDLMRHGEYYKGLEQMVPNGVGNALKGMRFSSQGITLRNGDVVLPPDEVSFIDGVMQGVGLPTTMLQQRQLHQGVKMNFEQYYAQKSGELKADYMRAYKSNEADDMAEARDAWMTLQESRRRNGFKPEPLSQLIKSPQAQAKRERQTEGGVEYRRDNRAFVDRVVFPEGGPTPLE